MNLWWLLFTIVVALTVIDLAGKALYYLDNKRTR